MSMEVLFLAQDHPGPHVSGNCRASSLGQCLVIFRDSALWRWPMRYFVDCPLVVFVSCFFLIKFMSIASLTFLPKSMLMLPVGKLEVFRSKYCAYHIPFWPNLLIQWDEVSPRRSVASHSPERLLGWLSGQPPGSWSGEFNLGWSGTTEKGGLFKCKIQWGVLPSRH